jgi:nicotinamidase-related amidase
MNQRTNKALIVIDLQNDYFPEGKFPLWNTEETLLNIETAISKANKQNIPVVIVQHIANSEMGIAPFFNNTTVGAEIHHRILQAAPNAKIVIKEFADSFEQTDLEEILEELHVGELLICGMMTQNCVTHTAISKKAENYNVTVLVDCCTTVDKMIHNIALRAMANRVELLPTAQAL